MRFLCIRCVCVCMCPKHRCDIIYVLFLFDFDVCVFDRFLLYQLLLVGCVGSLLCVGGCLALMCFDDVVCRVLLCCMCVLCVVVVTLCLHFVFSFLNYKYYAHHYFFTFIYMVFVCSLICIH